MSNPELNLFDKESVFKARKGVLLREAGRQFAQKGFHGISLTDIAKGVNLTKSGLFHYVKTKEELLFLCYEDAINSAEESMKAALEIDGDALDKLAHYVRLHLCKFDQPGGFYVILSELFVLCDENQNKIRKRARKIDQDMRQLVQSGIDDGVIGYSNARMAVYAIEGTLNWIPKWYSQKGKESIDEIAESFIDFFIHGLKSR